MIKTKLHQEFPVGCDKCLEPITKPPYIRWILNDNDELNLCVPCADLLSRGLFHDVQIIQDLQGKGDRHPGRSKRKPVDQYPQFTRRK